METLRTKLFLLLGVLILFTPIGTGAVCGRSGEKSGETLRSKVVARMREMATIPWTPSEDIVYWNPKHGVVFKKGERYTGLPYTQRNRQTPVTRFKKYLDSDGHYVGPADYLGSDCSSSVSNAWRAVDPEFPFLSTHLMFPGMGDVAAVGNYRVTSLNLTSTIVQDNGKEVMFAAYACLKPGDAVMTRYETDGHVRLVSQNDPERQCVYTIEQSGVIDHGKTVAEHSTWRVDREIPYEELFKTNYIPITHKSLAAAEGE